MKGRLVEIEAGRRAASFPLREGETLLGRDASVDLRFDVPAVSRRHAVVTARNDHCILTDLGSSNGTELNGRPVHGSVRLAPGDRIVLAGEIELEYEADETVWPRRVLLAGGGLLVVALGVGGALWWWSRSEAVPPKARALAAEAVQAARADDPATTKAKLQSAAGILFRRGQLSDVPRADVMRVAMERLGEGLEEPTDLWALFRESLEATRPGFPPSDGRTTGCRLDEVGASDLEACLRTRIELVMVSLRQDPSRVPDDFHRVVASRMKREHGFLRASFERGRSLEPMLRRELEAAHMPPILHYLALIESGYKTDAVSPARAVGLWQFMPGTARQYGLVVSGSRDDRRDRDKSTRAAARYLRDLAFEFGGDALLLALAGYNRGENGVRRALKKLDNPFSDRSYWRLVEAGLLPAETSLYVARFVAAAAAGEGGLPSPATLDAAGY